MACYCPCFPSLPSALPAYYFLLPSIPSMQTWAPLCRHLPSVHMPRFCSPSPSIPLPLCTCLCVDWRAALLPLYYAAIPLGMGKLASACSMTWFLQLSGGRTMQRRQRAGNAVCSRWKTGRVCACGACCYFSSTNDGRPGRRAAVFSAAISPAPAAPPSMPFAHYWRYDRTRRFMAAVAAAVPCAHWLPQSG